MDEFERALSGLDSLTDESSVSPEAGNSAKDNGEPFFTEAPDGKNIILSKENFALLQQNIASQQEIQAQRAVLNMADANIRARQAEIDAKVQSKQITPKEGKEAKAQLNADKKALENGDFDDPKYQTILDRVNGLEAELKTNKASSEEIRIMQGNAILDKEYGELMEAYPHITKEQMETVNEKVILAAQKGKELTMKEAFEHAYASNEKDKRYQEYLAKEHAKANRRMTEEDTGRGKIQPPQKFATIADLYNSSMRKANAEDESRRKMLELED